MYRQISDKIKNQVANNNKVVVLLGARQTGKTTLLKNTFPEAVYINLEKSDYVESFNSRDLEKIKSIIKQESKNDNNLLILDEAQRLDDPGIIAKLIHDELKEVKLIISGSSSLEIANKASESLAGRKYLIEMYPLTFEEKLIQTKKIDEIIKKEDLKMGKTRTDVFKDNILESMRYGMYPDLLNTKDKEDYLLELIDSTILKDVFYLNLVKNTKNLQAILKLLAYQIGQQVNISDLSNRVGIARPTVIEYLEILKKIYVIYTLPPFTKRRRDEIGKTEKIYFWDLGIRNAIINDFSPVEFRRDYGNIFENFVINELQKINKYNNLRYNFYYWRTKWGSEVDLVLHKDEAIIASEIKTRSGKITSAFTETYPESHTQLITVENLNRLLV
ncbi:ATP-binding protein [Candidatus Microgenomates bacterium]|nr:ATP-binding protein [Candidatus Microgenomates bacterium]